MLDKTIILTVLLMLASSISACGFMTETAGNPNQNSILKTAPAEQNYSKTVSANGKTGRYEYKTGNNYNEINIRELGENQISVIIFAAYAFMEGGGEGIRKNEARGTATLKSDMAVFTPENLSNCKITMKFSGDKITVKQSSCRFDKNVTAEGIYKKVSGKPQTKPPAYTVNDEERDDEDSNISKSDAPKKLAEFTYLKNKHAVYLILNQSDIEDDEKFIKLAQKLHDAEPNTLLILIDDDSGLKQYLAYHKEVDRLGGGAPDRLEFPRAWAEEHILSNVGWEEANGRRKWFLMEGYRFEKVAELK